MDFDETPDTEERYLITVELRDGNVCRVRSVLHDTDVSEEDMRFYYREILGMPTLEVSLKSRRVPKSFTLSLLGAAIQEIPAHFPSHDVETDDEGLQKYYRLLERVYEMEQMRVECGVARTATSPSSAAKTSTGTGPAKRTTAYAAWVQQVLSKMKATMGFGDAEDETTQDIADTQTIAWILTPVLEEMRETRGCRVITDTDVGCAWAFRLGSDVFPDVAVCRRISTVRWRANTPRAKQLARLAIEWYVEAQMLDMPNTGISPWILNADHQLASVLVPFQSVGPTQYASTARRRHGVNTEGVTTEAEDVTHPVMAIISQLESEHIASALTEDNVLELPKDVWEAYLVHIFRHHGISKELMDAVWPTVENTIQMWIRANRGILLTPLFPSWSVLWTLLMTECPKPAMRLDRFRIFLRTLDAYDPLKRTLLTTNDRYGLTNDWVRVFFEKEMIVTDSDKDRVPSALFYDQMREWCLTVMPLQLFDTCLRPNIIGPAITRMGFVCIKTKRGRFLLNVRYKNPPAVAAPVTSATDAAATNVTSDDVATTNTSNPYTLHSFLHVSADTDEIHLGEV